MKKQMEFKLDDAGKLENTIDHLRKEIHILDMDLVELNRRIDNLVVQLNSVIIDDEPKPEGGFW